MTHEYGPEHDNQIATLLKLAGRRRAPSTRQMARAREAARAEWRRAIQARGRRRLLMIAAAFVAAGALGSATWFWPIRSAPAVDRPVLATLQRVIGTIRIADAAGQPVNANGLDQHTGLDRSPNQLRAGDRIEIAELSRAAFALVDGTSVRLASGTLVVLDANNRLELKRGMLYVDANPERRTGAVVVDTPFGQVSHVGTQFELRLEPDSLNVRVREGEVVVDGGGARQTSRAGGALRISRDRPVERSTIATSGPEWEWVASIAQPFTLEGATVSAFLQWVSREQGWRWEYADAATKRLAERAVLHGSIEGLTPEEALAAVLPASGLTSRRDGNRLIVSAS